MLFFEITLLLLFFCFQRLLFPLFLYFSLPRIPDVFLPLCLLDFLNRVIKSNICFSQVLF